MQLNQSPANPRKIDHLELSEANYNLILAHLSNAPYKHAAPILELMTKTTTVVYQDQLGRPNPLGPGVPRGRIVDNPPADGEKIPEPEGGAEPEHVPIMTLQECADAEQKDGADGPDGELPWDGDTEKVAKSDAGGAQ